MAARAPGTIVAVAAGVLAGTLAAIGQTQDPVFRASVDQVRVDAAVTRGDTPVPGLTIGNFEIRDNGVPQTVDAVYREEVPLRLVLVLDTSTSVEGERLRGLQAAAASLVGALRPADEVGLVTFTQILHLSVAPTVRHDEVMAGLASLEAGGATAWRDALFAGLQLAGAPAEARPVVLLFGDGEDTASWIEASAIDEAVRRSGVVVHAVGLNPRDIATRRRGIPQSLQRTVTAGGGRFWGTESPDELGQQFARVLDELRGRYLLVYTPRETPSPGWHDVRVRLRGVSADVRARPGYFVGTK